MLPITYILFHLRSLIFGDDCLVDKEIQNLIAKAIISLHTSVSTPELICHKFSNYFATDIISWFKSLEHALCEIRLNRKNCCQQHEDNRLYSVLHSCLEKLKKKHTKSANY